MSGLVEKARAFAAIADSLPADERVRVAEHLASLIAPKKPIGAAVKQPALFPAPVEPNRIDGQLSVAVFLERKGFTGMGQVKAPARLSSWLAAEWVARFGDDDRQPVGFVPIERVDLLERLYESRASDLEQFKGAPWI